MNAIRFSCNQLVLCDTMCKVPKSFIPILGAEFIVLQPGVIEIEDDIVNINSQVQPATASREVAAAGKPGQRVGAVEEPGQMVKSQGSGGIRNLWQEETRSMGFADNQDLRPGDYAVSRTEIEIDDETADAEKEKHFKTKARKKQTLSELCYRPLISRATECRQYFVSLVLA